MQWAPDRLVAAAVERLAAWRKHAAPRPAARPRDILNAGIRLKSAATRNTQPMRKTTSSALTPEPAEPANYETALAELEKLVQQLEGGQMPLEELLTAYQRGAQLLAYCRDKLEAVEQQVKVLEGKELKPWAQE